MLGGLCEQRDITCEDVLIFARVVFRLAASEGEGWGATIKMRHRQSGRRGHSILGFRSLASWAEQL